MGLKAARSREQTSLMRKTMPTTMVSALIGVGLLTLLPVPAEAFWQRGQIFACADATSEGERVRLRCWELDPYATTLPAPVGLEQSGKGSYRFNHPPGADGLRRGPVARRLG